MLEKYLVTEDIALSTAVEKINQNGNGIVCIINGEGDLKGVFTDGDFRRSILSGAKLSDSVAQWMNKNFTSIQSTMSLEEGKRLLLMNRKRHMPILLGNKLVDILFLNDFEVQDTPIVLMVGGLGSRLYPLTKDLPKPMIKIGKKPILEEIINNFVYQGFTNIILSVNYKKEKIMDYFKDGKEFGASITYIEEEKALGTAGSLSLMKDILNDYKQFIVMNGDILAQVNFVDLLKEHNNKEANVTICARKYILEVPFGVLEHNNYQIKRIVEKPSYHHLVSSGIYMMNRGTLASLEENIKKDIPELINERISSGDKVFLYEMNGYWFDIGTIEQLEKVKSLEEF